MSMSKMSPEVIAFAYFHPRCVIRHSSSVLAQSRLWRNGFLWKIRGAERRSGENSKRAIRTWCARFAGTNRYWLVLQSTREKGEGDHVPFIYAVYAYVVSIRVYIRTLPRVRCFARDSSRARNLEQISGFTNSSTRFVSEKSAARLT